MPRFLDARLWLFYALLYYTVYDSPWAAGLPPRHYITVTAHNYITVTLGRRAAAALCGLHDGRAVLRAHLRLVTACNSLAIAGRSQACKSGRRAGPPASGSAAGAGGGNQPEVATNRRQQPFISLC